jgi:hypothetical protein
MRELGRRGGHERARREMGFARAGASSLELVAVAQDQLWSLFEDVNTPPGIRYRAAVAILVEAGRGG